MRRVLLSGYYGFGNQGDEATLEAAVEAFKKNQVEVSVLSHHPEQTSKTLGITAYNRHSLKDIVAGIRRADLVLSGGGGLLQDITSVRSLMYYLRIPMLAKLFRKKTMLFGQGIGPIRTESGKWLMKCMGTRVFDKIAVRDEMSSDLLKSLGFRKPIETTADLTFLLPVPDAKMLEQIERRFKLDKTKYWLGVSIRAWTAGEHLPEFADVISKIAQEENLTPLLIPFQADQDKPLLQKLSKQLTIPHRMIPEPVTPKELLGIFSKLNFMVGMRFHALAFAAKNRVPFLGISYDPKVHAIAKEFDMPVISLEEYSPQTFQSRLRQALQNRISSQTTLEQRVPGITLRAKRNIEIALELLEK